jgi:hypothetical protein
MKPRPEQIETCSKKGRGMAKASLDLIDAMHAAAKAAQPITGRGVGYKLFTAGLIPSMETKEMAKVYRLLRQARERDIIPWEWIVDETRSLEMVPVWDDPEEYARCVARDYRRDFWNQQSVRCEVWSEKGTVRGVLAPVLDEYGVGFRVMHGFASATAAHDAALDYDGRDLVVLYVGDFDPSGLFMSEEDLPARLAKYDGDHIDLRRIALTSEHLRRRLPSFSAADKKKDPRYRWFASNYGNRCWELDAMDPNDLRDCVEAEIEKLIEPIAWQRCAMVNKAEQESLRDILKGWRAPRLDIPASLGPRQQAADAPLPRSPPLSPFYEEALKTIETFEGSASQLLDWWRSKAKDRAKLAIEDQTHLSQLYTAKFRSLPLHEGGTP